MPHTVTQSNSEAVAQTVGSARFGRGAMRGQQTAAIEVVLGTVEAEARLARAEQRLPGALRRLLETVAGELTRRALVRTPVRTGRARAAWVSVLEQRGEVVPAGWQGGDPDAEAIAEGRQLGHVQSQIEGHEQEIEIANAVPYVVSLELGSRGRPGRHMVRRSMLEVREQIRPLFQRLVKELF